MENNIYKAYAEVDKILSFMEEIYVEKIPNKMREMFKNEKLQNYEPEIDLRIPLEEQNLQRKTYAILAMLNLNYWCDENEKQELLKLYAENDRKKEEEFRKKFNPDNMFKKKEKENIVNIEENNTALVEYKESSFIQKIMNKIINLFKKNK